MKIIREEPQEQAVEQKPMPYMQRVAMAVDMLLDTLNSVQPSESMGPREVIRWAYMQDKAKMAARDVFHNAEDANTLSQYFEEQNRKIITPNGNNGGQGIIT